LGTQTSHGEKERTYRGGVGSENNGHRKRKGHISHARNLGRIQALSKRPPGTVSTIRGNRQVIGGKKGTVVTSGNRVKDAVTGKKKEGRGRM